MGEWSCCVEEKAKQEKSVLPQTTIWKRLSFAVFRGKNVVLCYLIHLHVCVSILKIQTFYLFLKPPLFSEKCYILYNFFKSDKTQLPAQRSKRPSAKWDLINLMSMFWEHIWLEKSLNRMHIRLLNATMMCVIANLSCNSLARAVYLHYRFRE